ncbi:MAG TPA: MerR family transcriptional regulator [Steroidobacteraceae bacterium]|nr:MerR family transcriptional regulator [Steroidobacteraceae bacterium]
MFKIGEFSRIARVSARLLRFYDELGLLRPGVVDAATGYRFYTTAQLQRLNRILVLKDLGLSLEQIGGVIDEQASAEQLRAMLLVRRSDAERALAEEAARLRLIESRIAQLDAGASALDDVLIRAEPARRVITVRDTLSSFVEARGIIGQLAQTLPKHVPREALGTLIGIAHSAEFEPDAIDVELGYVLTGEPPARLPALGERRLAVRELAAVPHMAVCIRVGLPEHAHLITGKIGQFVEANGYRLAGAGREVFLRPPRPDRMEESVVEMQFPVERA